VLCANLKSFIHTTAKIEGVSKWKVLWLQGGLDWFEFSSADLAVAVARTARFLN
jgi:hypothetical protein